MNWITIMLAVCAAGGAAIGLKYRVPALLVAAAATVAVALLEGWRRELPFGDQVWLMIKLIFGLQAGYLVGLVLRDRWRRR